MANSINVNGCSVCQPGRENYTSFTAKIGRKTVKRWQYDYRTESGELFSCVGESLDNWREPTRRTTSTASRYGAFTTMIC